MAEDEKEGTKFCAFLFFLLLRCGIKREEGTFCIHVCPNSLLSPHAISPFPPVVPKKIPQWVKQNIPYAGSVARPTGYGTVFQTWALSYCIQ